MSRRTLYTVTNGKRLYTSMYMSHEKTQVKSTVSTTSRRDLIFVIPEGVCNLIQYVIQ